MQLPSKTKLSESSSKAASLELATARAAIGRLPGGRSRTGTTCQTRTSSSDLRSASFRQKSMN